MITSVMDDDLPDNGDRVMCFQCGKFAIFHPDARGKLRKPTRSELQRIAADEDCRRMAMLWAMHSC